jgi:hypothetical protein
LILLTAAEGCKVLTASQDEDDAVVVLTSWSLSMLAA